MFIVSLSWRKFCIQDFILLKYSLVIFFRDLTLFGDIEKLVYEFQCKSGFCFQYSPERIKGSPNLTVRLTLKIHRNSNHLKL